MRAEGRTDAPPAEFSASWVRPSAPLLFSGRLLNRHGVRWVPVTLMAEFDALYATPLPTSAEQRG